MFNEQQLDIINLKNPRISVLAGAGSGKSTTVTGRIAQEIKDGVPEHKIAVITFTNEACDSVRKKLEANGVDTDEMIVKTLHGFCYSIYGNYCDFNRIKKMTIISKAEKAFAQTFWKLVGVWKGLPSKSLLRFMGFIFKCQINRMTPVQALEQHYKEENLAPRLLVDLQREAISQKPMLSMTEYYVLVYDAYEMFKKNTGQLDFTDMLNYAINALETCPKTLNYYRRKIKSLYVDESQDTNALVIHLLRHLVSEEMNVVLVGDTRQSIYSFMNASPKGILEYMDENNYVRLPLQTNYRSGKNIVDNANKFIRNYPDVNLGGDLLCSKPDLESNVFSKVSDNEIEEKHTVIQMLNDLRAQGHQYKDIAILYRTNAQAMLLIDYVVTNDIPFVIKKESSSIFSRPEMKDIFTYLKLFNMPHLTTVEDVRRIGNKPTRYVPNKAYDGIKDPAFGKSLLQGEYDRNDKLEKLSSELALHYKRVQGLTLADQINYIAREVGYIQHWEKSMSDAMFDISLYFNCLSSLVETYDTYPKLIKQVNKIKKALKDRNETEGLNFYSIHGSKGLEFPVTIVLGVCDRLYPFYRAVQENGKEGADEEARLFYVASTRAIQHLYYSEIVGNFGRYKVVPSPFIRNTNRILLNPYPTEGIENEKDSNQDGEDEKTKRNIIRRERGWAGTDNR